MLKSAMSHIRDLWDRLIRSRYVRLLESEIERLRAENRALMNSILGIAGVPPVVTPDSPSVQGNASANQTASQSVAPIRRRSWQQVNRALEIEAVKKKEPEGGA